MAPPEDLTRPNRPTTMSFADSRVRQLELEISRLKEENANLKLKIPNGENPKKRPRSETSEEEEVELKEGEKYQPWTQLPSPVETTALSPDQIERYSRQLLLQEGFGVRGQGKLLSSSVLVVGAGGIGSTVLLYLAASGIGRISVLDFDAVETSNLHRQIIHKQQNVGLNKAVSACRTLLDLNPSIQCRPLETMLNHDNALEIIQDHDCIVDASDNPRTRYLINDACVLAGKPLISGSAIGTEGQLSVFNWKDGPCYRCLFPKPDITSGAKSCSDNGVLGPVPGLIGVLQSLEVIKVLTETGNPMDERMLMYDSLQCAFMNIKKPKKQSTCPVCSTNATIRSMADSDKDLQSARGPASCDMYTPSFLPPEYQISCKDYQLEVANTPHILLDVRVKEQFDLCGLEQAVNIPLGKLQESMDEVERLTEGWTKPVYCMCRRGIFSVEATKLLTEYLTSKAEPKKVTVKNIKGGLEAWRKHVDQTFPKY